MKIVESETWAYPRVDQGGSGRIKQQRNEMSRESLKELKAWE